MGTNKADYLKLIGTRGQYFFSFFLFFFLFFFSSFLLTFFGGKEAKMKLLFQMAMMITWAIYFTGVRSEPEVQPELEEQPEIEEQSEIEEQLEEREERLKNMIQKAVKRLAISKECQGLAWFKCAITSLGKGIQKVHKGEKKSLLKPSRLNMRARE